MIKRLGLVTLGAVLMALNIKTFVHAGGLIPGGFTGVSLLIQEIGMRFFSIRIPFSAVLFALNAVPVVFCFRFIGKKFTMYSVLMVILSGLMTDFMPDIIPAMFANFINPEDALLFAVFGGILNAIAVVLCLYADASSGGTDFIAIYISEKHRKDAWNYIFAGNFVILAVAGILFTLDKALYSIIFQFTTTMVLNFLYRNYQQNTLLIVTSRPQEVYDIIREKTGHGATNVTGTGMYNNTERALLYSVVCTNEVTQLMSAIRAIDPDAFINIIKTEQVNGRFFTKPKD